MTFWRSPYGGNRGVTIIVRDTRLWASWCLRFRFAACPHMDAGWCGRLERPEVYVSVRWLWGRATLTKRVKPRGERRRAQALRLAHSL